MKIPTTGADGKPNGYVIPIWNALEVPELRPEQVYLTAVAPHSRKGPHLHMKRRGCFVCIRGDVRIVSQRSGNGIPSHRLVEMSGEHHQYRRVVVPPGVPAAIYNDGEDEALVLNLPSPAWSAADPDEHPVTDWVD